MLWAERQASQRLPGLRVIAEQRRPLAPRHGFWKEDIGAAYAPPVR